MQRAAFVLFQSRTGFPGHLALGFLPAATAVVDVSIPNGLPRPFSRYYVTQKGTDNDVSIPNGLPRPFSRRLVPDATGGDDVSIPNGLPRPFSLQTALSRCRQAIWFQSRTGFPGHLAAANGVAFML